MNTKNGILHFFAVSSALAIGMLTASCVTMVPIELSGDYRSMLLSPAGNERVIDRVSINRVIPELADRRCFGDCRPRSVGATYQVPENRAAERHVSELVLNQAINEARRRFPNEAVNIRNASISRTQHSDPQQVVFRRHVQGDRRWNEYRTAWICTPNLITVDITTTEPMPQPVSHSDTITVTPAGGGTITASDGSIIGHIAMTQVTRGDLYRRAHNWLTDNNPRGSVEIQGANFDLGRITGQYCIAYAELALFKASI